MKKEIVESNSFLNFFNEIETLISKDRYDGDSIGNFKGAFPFEIERLEQVWKKYISGNDLSKLKTEIYDKWKHLSKKLAYPYEYIDSLDDYQKPVNNFFKKGIFSKLKNFYPNDNGIERTDETFKIFKKKNGEVLTKLYLKSHAKFFIQTYVSENFVRVANNEFDINLLSSIRSLGCTWFCGLKYMV